MKENTLISSALESNTVDPAIIIRSYKILCATAVLITVVAAAVIGFYWGWWSP